LIDTKGQSISTVAYIARVAVVFPLYNPTYSKLPESPRWLLVQRQYERAERVLRSMAKVNGAGLPADFDAKHINVVSTITA